MEENFLLDLIKISSESGKEKEIGEFIIRRLKSSFNIRKQKIKNNFNILAYVGKPKILFSCHLDVVPGKLKIKKDKRFIHGRGACDTKSQIAASILASEKAIEKGLSNFGLLFTVQEETDFAGAKKVAKLIPNSVNLIVIGEPTNLDIVKGQKGLLTFKIVCRGKAAHGATPKKGVNAIELLMNSLQKLKKIKFEKDKELGENTINIGKISGGTNVNIVPDYAEAIIDIRAAISPVKLVKKMKQELNADLEIINIYEPVFSKRAETLARKLKLKTKTVSYFTEAAFLNKRAETIVLGAGSIDDAHSNKEKVKIKDFKKLISIYSNLIKEYQN